MGEKTYGLSDQAKNAAYIIGYCGGTIVLCYVMYKWWAALVGKAIVKELIKAGIVTVL